MLRFFLQVVCGVVERTKMLESRTGRYVEVVSIFSFHLSDAAGLTRCAKRVMLT